MSSADIKMLLNPTTSIDSLRAYFKDKPVPSRGELAKLRTLLANRRYKDVDPGLFNLLGSEIPPTTPSLCLATQ